MSDNMSRLIMDMRGDLQCVHQSVKERFPECVECEDGKNETIFGGLHISYDEELGGWIEIFINANFKNSIEDIEIGSLYLGINECKMMKDFLTCVIRRMEER